MKCNVKIHNGVGIISAWSDDCDELFDLVLQPLPQQKKMKCYQTTQLRAFNLISFFKKNNIDVEVVIEDPAEHARFTIWAEKLRCLRTNICDSEVEEFHKDLNIEFRALQKRGMKKILQSHFALVAIGCGGGKTLLNLGVIQFKKRKSSRVLTFVTAPSACVSEYVKELNRFRGYFDLTMLDTSGMSSKDARLKISESDCDVILVSIDSINQLQSTIQQKIQDFNGETLLIVEEGHCVKNAASKRSQGLQLIAPLVDQVIVATATPLPLGAKDLRGYIALVGLPQPEEAYAGGIPAGDYALLRGVAFITDEEDVPFAPVESENIEFSDLEDLNSKILDSVISEIKDGHKVVIFTSTNKALQSAYNLFSGIPRTVLSGSFHVADSAHDELIKGSNKEQQKRAIEDFNHNPNCKVLIANYKVGSTGLNLQYSGARMAIFYEITNSGADLFQSRYRIRRPNVFPAGGFRYVYALPTNPKERKTVNRQFIKLAEQSSTLRDLKSQIGGF
ncbi:hypothetical protein DOM21_07150 [Bacteriovorax stolpii]|uniref:SNF2-related protein n=1 Tax=Bacteriovorax stolpii TaxID=960 RepID=UPI00115BF3CD|nr:SNF2-related protein [Bacteriovorax stolpii]QDK41236.1 hypothetical protein DOM21_07150 [Bacteriovorax stolpii]